MTVPMDSYKDNSSRERAQHLFNENLRLENRRRKAVQERVPLDPNVWQNMRENYEAIVLEDHDFSEQHDIEYALWQLHYRRIEELRALLSAAMASAGPGVPPNGKGPGRSGPERLAKIRSSFKSFLTEASGFYHDLMLKIRAKYGLPLGYFSDDLCNQIPTSKGVIKSSKAENGLISCHRCLIYLGDLARYKGLYGEGDSKSQDFSAASSYYMQACSIWSSSGNPHHQLAILAGYSNDELLSIYRYFRSLAVENPFATARDNLVIAFEKNRQTYNQLCAETKAASGKVALAKMAGKGRNKSRTPIKGNKMEAFVIKERSSNHPVSFRAFITSFIRLNGILFTRTSLETFAEVLLAAKNDLMELMPSGLDEGLTFGSDAVECKLTIVRMSAILIFSVHNVSRENSNHSYADTLQRSVLLQNAFTAAFEFMGCIVERCNQLKDPGASFLLPGILIFVEWLACHQDSAVGNELEEKQANARAFFWKGCVSFFNNLLSTGYVLVNEDEDESCFMNMINYDQSETSNRLALPEDFELRGFVPLLPAQLILDFSRKASFEADSGHKVKVSRIQRIVAAGKALANVILPVKEGFYFDTKLKIFVFGSKAANESSELSGDLPDTSTGGHMGMAVLPRVDANIDTEDDDEVIVFKPFTTEKAFDEISSKMASSTNISPVCAHGQIDLGIDNEIPVSHDHFKLQSIADAGIKPPAALNQSMTNGISHNLAPFHRGWSSDHATAATNELAELKLRDNQMIPIPELYGGFGISQPAVSSLPTPQFSSIVTSHGPSAQSLQTHLPFESILPYGASSDVPSVKQSSIGPPGLKKNPLNRHVRHFGPPPGFGSVPSKSVDDPAYNIVSRSESFPTPAMDDYSWLDGYNLSPQRHNLGFNTSANQMSTHQLNTEIPSVNHLGSMSVKRGTNISMGTETFPFPGKPVSSLHFNSTDQILSDVSFPEYMNHYDGLQEQFQNGNHQTTYSTEQLSGNSVWGGRSFV